ncbi:hypothetical protein HY624_01890 [Candidatus Uhrbacteria bacterium]|nr:hypothetical protein [Candidatus Uhrbacteria bacterium]
MTRGGLDETWTPNDVFERLKELVREDCMKKLMDVERQRNKAQDESKKLLRALHADTKLKKLVSIAKELVYYRTYRTDYLNLTLFHVRPLLMEIGRRIGKYSFQQISYFREQEIVRWKPVQRTEIARRMQNFFLFAVNPHACIFTADPKKTKALELEYVEQEKIESNKIKGNAAFLGKVQGRVVMVLSKKDLPKVTRGDILVSTMTTPDYIVAMEKAAAFVTDEGGITCHAAIVAREMKKPCIIGTKIATKVLKDGDRVEVDAAHGLVKKIS